MLRKGKPRERLAETVAGHATDEAALMMNRQRAILQVVASRGDNKSGDLLHVGPALVAGEEHSLNWRWAALGVKYLGPLTDPRVGLRLPHGKELWGGDLAAVMVPGRGGAVSLHVAQRNLAVEVAHIDEQEFGRRGT